MPPDDPHTLRKPNGSFVRFGRFPREEIPAGFARLAPDLAVEVPSIGDAADGLETKVEYFRAAGVPLVWVVYPGSRKIHVHRTGPAIAKLYADDELSGEDILPGFCCRVADLFPASPTPPAGG